MRKKLTAGFVAKPDPPENHDRAIYWDTEVRGLALVITKAGHRSWAIQFRNDARQSRRMTPRSPGLLSLSAARHWAKTELAKVAHGRDPLAEKRRADSAGKNTLAAICDEYLTREGHKLRTAGDRKAALVRLVYPTLGKRQIDEIKRSEIVRLLDRIEDESGARMASLTLAYLSRIFNWHAGRDDDFLTPVVRGMARGTTTRRDRTLDDDELRAVWRAADDMTTPLARLVQFILLTATRRSEAAQMTRDELDGDTWTIPAARMKAKAEHVIPLSRKALGILATLPSIGTGRFVFTTNGEAPIGNLDRSKVELDRLSGTSGWRLHDLRRTARSLLSRAGVDADIAERCLAHSIGGVRGIYDRHRYLEEKRRAFEALAAQVDRILDPQPNVVPLHAPAR